MADYSNAFEDLDVRRWRQVRTHDERTDVRTAARACTASSEYYLVRWIGADLEGLTSEQKHFIANNETPAERAAREISDV